MNFRIKLISKFNVVFPSKVWGESDSENNSQFSFEKFLLQLSKAKVTLFNILQREFYFVDNNGRAKHLIPRYPQY